MTDDELKAIRERAEEASPGPWTCKQPTRLEYNNLPVILNGCGCVTFYVHYVGDGPFVAHSRTDIPALLAEIDRLHEAVRLHHSQKADDRCIEDDAKLYAAFGLPPHDCRVGDKAAMLKNCERFIERRCEGGGWPTYQELEAERDAAHEALRSLACWLSVGGYNAATVDAGIFERKIRDAVESLAIKSEAKCDGLRERVVKLQRFKDWVHEYLDGKGIPTHPDGPHSKEGCRIGDRMDYVFAEIERLRGVLQTIQGWDCLYPVPQRELCCDFPWLKKLVDDALGGPKP